MYNGKTGPGPGKIKMEEMKMHKKLGIRALALVLAMVMVLGLTPAASASYAGASHLGAYKTIADYLEAQKTTFDQIAPETEVEFIVELENAPRPIPFPPV
jgi:hypothetical protein